MVKNTKNMDFNLRLEFSRYINQIIKSAVNDFDEWKFLCDGLTVTRNFSEKLSLYFNLGNKVIAVTPSSFSKEDDYFNSFGLQLKNIKSSDIFKEDVIESLTDSKNYSDIIYFINSSNKAKKNILNIASKNLFEKFKDDDLSDFYQYGQTKIVSLHTFGKLNRTFSQSILFQKETDDPYLIEIYKKQLQKNVEYNDGLPAQLFYDLINIDENLGGWNAYKLKDLEKIFDKKTIQLSFVDGKSVLNGNYSKVIPFLFYKTKELMDYLLSDTDNLSQKEIYSLKTFLTSRFFSYKNGVISISYPFSKYLSLNLIEIPHIKLSPYSRENFHKSMIGDLHKYMVLSLKYLFERINSDQIVFNLSDQSHKDISVTKGDGRKTLCTFKNYYRDLIWFIKKLQKENKDLFNKINFVYDSDKSFARVLSFKNTSLFEYSGFKIDISNDEYYYYLTTKILCKTFDFFSEIMKDNDKTELELLQREVTLYRDQVELIKNRNKNK
jgi:hypothetical protein